MKLGYVRMSTVEQNEARQMATMNEFDVEKIFSEKVSAKYTNRPRLWELLEFTHEGDVIYIHDFSRLARSTQDLFCIVETMKYFSIIHFLFHNSKEIFHLCIIQAIPLSGHTLKYFFAL